MHLCVCILKEEQNSCPFCNVLNINLLISCNLIMHVCNSKRKKNTIIDYAFMQFKEHLIMQFDYAIWLLCNLIMQVEIMQFDYAFMQLKKRTKTCTYNNSSLSLSLFSQISSNLAFLLAPNFSSSPSAFCNLLIQKPIFVSSPWLRKRKNKNLIENLWVSTGYLYSLYDMFSTYLYMCKLLLHTTFVV